MGDVVNLLDVTSGRAALGAAPSPQKRGPRRPPRTGRRGRLPIKLANPRRDSVVPLVPSKNCDYAILNPSLKSAVKNGRVRSVLAVVAWLGRPPIAMVRRLGMAMALLAAAGDLLGTAARDKPLESDMWPGPAREWGPSRV